MEEKERTREREKIEKRGERQWARDPHKLGFLNSRKDRRKDVMPERCKDGVFCEM